MEKFGIGAEEMVVVGGKKDKYFWSAIRVGIVAVHSDEEGGTSSDGEVGRVISWKVLEDVLKS